VALFLRLGLARELTQDLDPVWATLFAIKEAPRRRPIRWPINSPMSSPRRCRVVVLQSLDDPQ
jgi:hypothetical protein